VTAEHIVAYSSKESKLAAKTGVMTFPAMTSAPFSMTPSAAATGGFSFGSFGTPAPVASPAPSTAPAAFGLLLSK
jgi:hypothetical protein